MAVLDQAAAGPIVGSLSPGMTFDPTSGTLDALVNGGRLGLIDDPTLREGLATWLRALEDILENETDIRAGSLRVQIGMEPHGGPFQVPVPGRNVNLNAFPKPTGATLSALKQDAGFMGRARSHQYQMSLYLRELHGISEILDANLATLDSLISDGGR